MWIQGHSIRVVTLDLNHEGEEVEIYLRRNVDSDWHLGFPSTNGGI
jgi:hypothetical protein